MKKFAIIMMVVLMMTIAIVPAVMADEGFEVKEIEYENYVLSGEVAAPCDDYFVRVTMFVDDGHYFIFCLPIENGCFHAHVFANCRYITVAIVDKINAFVPGTFHVYAAGEKFL